MTEELNKVLRFLKRIENVQSPIAAIAKLQELYENEQLCEEFDQIYSDLSVRDELIILQAFVKWRTSIGR